MVESTKRIEPNPDSHDGETYLSRYLKVQAEEFPIQNPINFTTRVNNTDVKLHSVEYPNEGELKGVVFFFLGYGGYCDFYGNQFKIFAQGGFRVFGFDRHGFGKSEGVRADTGPDLMGDQFRFVDQIVETFGLQDAKKFIFGTSMGGLICTRMMQIRPDYFSGAILNVPWFANHENSQLGYFKRMLLKTMSTLFRNRQIPLPNKNPEYDEFLTYLINKDPYYTGPIQFHMVEYGLTLQDQMNAQLDRIPNVPIYIVVAENEWVVSNIRIFEISNMLKHPKNKTVTYQHAVHALYYQNGFYQKVMGDLLDWLLDISQ